MGNLNAIAHDISRPLWLEGALRIGSTHFIDEEIEIKAGNEFPQVT